jgi:fatty acid-binding protein DegV
MKNAMKADMEGRLGGCNPKNIHLYGAYSHNPVEAEAWHKELEEAFPGFDIEMDPLSLSVCCHVGPGILAVACSRRIKL